MTLYNNLKEIRVRLHHYLTPEVGACAGLTQQELQQGDRGNADSHRRPATRVGNQDETVSGARTMSTEEPTGTDLLRQTLRARNSKMNLSTFSRDLGLSADTVHNFIFNGTPI